MPFTLANHPSIICLHQERCAVCKKYDAAVKVVREAETQVWMLRAALNESHDPFVRLPQEVVSHIFERFAEDLSERRNELFVLGAVCQLWREIAWSTPSLWTLVRLLLPCDYGRTNKFIDLLSEYIKRSGGLGIEVKILRYGSQDLDLAHVDLARIAPIVISCLSRCVSLELELPVLALHPFFQDTPPIYPPILRRLVFSTAVRQFEDEEMDELPRNHDNRVLDLTHITGTLEVLVLDGSYPFMCLDDVRVNGSNLTSISCRGSYTALVNLIRASPRLKTATIELNCGDGENGQPFVHESLQHLQLDENISSSRFMALSTFPNLETLSIDGYAIPSRFVTAPTVAGFLSRNGQVLRRLSLCQCTGGDLREILVPLPCLEELVTADTSSGTATSDILEIIFQVPVRGSLDANLGAQSPRVAPPAFPKLQKVQLENLYCDRVDDWECLQPIGAYVEQTYRLHGQVQVDGDASASGFPVLLRFDLFLDPRIPHLGHRHIEIMQKLERLGLRINISSNDCDDLLEYSVRYHAAHG